MGEVGGWVLVWIFVTAGSVGPSTDMGGGVSIGTQRFVTEEACREAKDLVAGRVLSLARYVNAACVFDWETVSPVPIPDDQLPEALKEVLKP